MQPSALSLNLAKYQTSQNYYSTIKQRDYRHDYIKKIISSLEVGCCFFFGSVWRFLNSAARLHRFRDGLCVK